MEREDRERKKKKGENPWKPELVSAADRSNNHKEDPWIEVHSRRWKKNNFQKKSKLRNKFDSSGAITYFVDNLSDSTSIDPLKAAFNGFGKLHDAYIPKKTSSRGGRYAFIRFMEVDDIKELENRLNGVNLDGAVLEVNIAKFDRSHRPYLFTTSILKSGAKEDASDKRVLPPPKHYNKFSKLKEHISFADVLRGSQARDSKLVTVEVKPGMENNDTCRDTSLVGLVGSFDRLSSLRDDLSSMVNGTRIKRTDVQYLGGFNVLLSFTHKDDASYFLSDLKDKWSIIFEKLDRWIGDFINFQRVAWIKISGIQLPFRNVETFKAVAEHFGEVIKLPDLSKDDGLLASCTVGILANHGLFINDRIIMSKNGNYFPVWVTEVDLDWTPNFMVNIGDGLHRGGSGDGMNGNPLSVNDVDRNDGMNENPLSVHDVDMIDGMNEKSVNNLEDDGMNGNPLSAHDVDRNDGSPHLTFHSNSDIQTSVQLVSSIPQPAEPVLEKSYGHNFEKPSSCGFSERDNQIDKDGVNDNGAELRCEGDNTSEAPAFEVAFIQNKDNDVEVEESEVQAKDLNLNSNPNNSDLLLESNDPFGLEPLIAQVMAEEASIMNISLTNKKKSRVLKTNIMGELGTRLSSKLLISRKQCHKAKKTRLPDLNKELPKSGSNIFLRNWEGNKASKKNSISDQNQYDVQAEVDDPGLEDENSSRIASEVQGHDHIDLNSEQRNDSEGLEAEVLASIQMAECLGIRMEGFEDQMRKAILEEREMSYKR